jgi:toxin ParE1/3/4
MRLKALPRAVRDLENIHAYISADSAEAAEAVMMKLAKSLNLITSRPELGRSVPDSKSREWSVPGLPYTIPYRVRGETVEVLRVFHTSRQRPPRWIG